MRYLLLLLLVVPAHACLSQNKSNSVKDNPSLRLIGQWESAPAITGDSLYQLLSAWDKYPAPAKTGTICEYTLRLDTNYTVPYFVYIPQHYDPKQKTVLLVYYKGGWLSRKTLPENYRDEITGDNPTFGYLDKYNIIEIFPALEAKLAIYGYYGYAHLQKMVTHTKQLFNIDDNRVFMAGFSDGGTSAYNAAYLAPSQFACFYPINGAIVSPPYYPNFLNRPVYSFVAEKDQLYHKNSILSKALYASELGANWSYRELPGRGHFYFPYQQEILPVMFGHMQTVVRHPHPPTITYHRGFNDTASFSGIDWLQFTANTNLPPTPFHFTDSVHTFRSNGEPNDYLYGEKTGQVKARYFNNCFTIETSMVSEVEIYISPLMVNMQLPVKVIVNGSERFNERVSYAKDFMAGNFMKTFDRQQVWVNKIVIYL